MKLFAVQLAFFLTLLASARADVTIIPGKKPSQTTKDFIKDQKKNGYPTPEPRDRTAYFVEGLSVDVELEVATSSLGTVRFSIKDAPRHGKLSEIRSHPSGESNKAMVTYTHSGGTDLLGDHFTFQAKLAEGTNTSAPGTVTLIGKRAMPRIDVLEIGRFKRLQPGEQDAQRIVVVNSGTAAFSSVLKWPDPFVGPPKLELAINEKQTFMLMIKAPAPGSYQVDQELQPGTVTSRLQVYVECVQPFSAAPSALAMKFDANEGRRSGTVKVTNGSDAQLKLHIDAPARLRVDKELTLEPKASKELIVSLEAKDVAMFHGELWVIQEPARQKVVIHAAPTPPQLALVSPNDGKIDFGKLEKGKKGEASITLTNTGGQPAILKVMSLPAPFSLMEQELPTVQPGKRVQLTMVFNPTQPGDYHNNFSLDGNAGHMDIALSGTMFDPNKSAAVNITNPHAPPRPGAQGGTTKRVAASDPSAMVEQQGPIVPPSLSIPPISPAPDARQQVEPQAPNEEAPPTANGKVTKLSFISHMSDKQLELYGGLMNYGLGAENIPQLKSKSLDAVPMLGVSDIGRSHVVLGWQQPKVEPKSYLVQCSKYLPSRVGVGFKSWEIVKDWKPAPAPPGYVAAKLEGLQPAHEYEYRVIGVDEKGLLSPSSGLLKIITLPPFQFPGWAWFLIVGLALALVALVIHRAREQRMLAV